MLDHLILNVNDVEASVAFYTEVMGFADDGTGRPLPGDPGQSVEHTSSWRPGGPRAASIWPSPSVPPEFEATFGRIREAGVPYGDSFHDVGNMRGPGRRGSGPGATGRRCTSSTPAST